MLAERIAATQLAEMAALGSCLVARLKPGDLPRLAGLLAPTAADPGHGLDLRVEFRAGSGSFPLVRFDVRGVLPLVCQRCGGAVDQVVDVDVLLGVVADDDEAQELPDPFDAVLLDDEGGLRLRDAVEDEVLAALPLAPRHVGSGDCRPMPGAQPAPLPQETRNRPFAGLGSLLGGQGRSSPDE